MTFTFTFIPQTPDQSAILDSGFLTSDRSGTLILPTGGGKSRLAWVAMAHTLSQSHKVIYLAPTKGVLEEQYRKWQQELKPEPEPEPEVEEENAPISLFDCIDFSPQPPGGWGGVATGGEEARAEAKAEGAEFEQRYEVVLEPVPTVGIFDSDYPTPVGAYQRTSILLMTPERLDLCLRHPSAQSAGIWLKGVGLCVVDEAQTIRDGHRGARLEGALTRLRWLNPACRWLALSADVNPNDEAFLGWVGDYVYHSTVRPVPQVWRLVNYRSRAEQAQKLIELLKQEPHLTLVFVSSRNRTSQVAQALNEAGILAEIHHAGRSAQERRDAEEQFQARELEALVATSTLAVGVNLPARQVVVYDLYKPNGPAIAAGATSWADRFMRLSLEEVEQLGGRAGRPGLDPQGDVILMAQEQDSWAKSLLSRIDRQPPQKPMIQSALCTDRSWVIEQVLALVNGGYGNSTETVQAVLQSSLAARQGQMPKGYELMALVERLMQGRMLNQDAGILTATALGRVCSGQYLMPATGLRWALSLEQVVAADELPTFLDWLALVSLSPDLKLLGNSDVFEGGVSLWLTTQTAVVRLHCKDDPDRVQRLYAHAGVLRAYTQSHGNAASVLDWAERLGLRLYPADLQAALENAGRLVEALVEVARALEQLGSTAQSTLASAIGKLQVLKQMLATGLDGDLVGLTLLDGIGPKRAQALSAVGLSTLADVASADPELIASVKGISAERAPKLIEQAVVLQGQVKQEWFRDAGNGLVAPICS